MTTVNEKAKHKPSEKHTLDEVLHSLQDLVRNDLLDEREAKPRRAPAIDQVADTPRRPGRPRKPPPSPDSPGENTPRGGRRLVRGDPLELDNVVRSLKQMIADELALLGGLPTADATTPSTAEADGGARSAAPARRRRPVALPSRHPSIHGLPAQKLPVPEALHVPPEGLQQALPFDHEGATASDALAESDGDGWAPEDEETIDLAPETKDEAADAEPSASGEGLSDDAYGAASIGHTEDQDDGAFDAFDGELAQDDVDSSFAATPGDEETEAPDDGAPSSGPRGAVPPATLAELHDVIANLSTLASDFPSLPVRPPAGGNGGPVSSSAGGATSAGVVPEWDDLPVLNDVVIHPAVAGADLRPPRLAPSRVRELAVRAVARLNIERRKSGGALLDPLTIDRLQQLLREELERAATKVDNKTAE